MKSDDEPGNNGPIIHSDSHDISPFIAGTRKMVVMFEMTSCPFCRAFLDRFLELARTRGRDFDFMRVAIDDPGNPLWHEYGIQAVPTVIVFSGGKIVSRLNSTLFVGISKKNWSEFCAGMQ